MSSNVELKVEGMTCQGCVRSVTKKLSGLDGVSGATVDLAAGRAAVSYDDARATVDDMIAAVEQIGFRAQRI